MKPAIAAAAVALLALAAPARATDVGEEVQVTAGVVTGLSCALQAREKGELKVLTACPPAEAAKELVVFDVAERAIYRIAPKLVRRSQLEAAFGFLATEYSFTSTVAMSCLASTFTALPVKSMLPPPKAASSWERRTSFGAIR